MTPAAKFLRGHGLLLAGLGSLLFTATLVGRLGGGGMFAFLQQNTVAAIGFHEAYALIAFIGVAIAIGAGSNQLRPWQLLAATVHLFLLTINLTHWNFYAELNMVAAGYASSIAHLILAAAELLLIDRNAAHRAQGANL